MTDALTSADVTNPKSTAITSGFASLFYNGKVDRSHH